MRTVEKTEQLTCGVVEPRTLTLRLPAEGFRLEEGGTLARVDVAWESCGLERPDNDNVVFICHALQIKMDCADAISMLGVAV